MIQKNIKKTIRFSEEEYKSIAKKLIECNITFTDFARKALLHQKIKFPFEKSLLYEIHGINISLELIARRLTGSNYDKRLLLLELAEIEKKIGELL